MAEERRLDQAVITVDGTRLPAEQYELLGLIRVEESVHLPDAFTLRFDDPHFELFDSMRFSMGTKVDIAFSAEGEVVTVTRGEVTAISVEQGPGGRHELVVSGMDITHRLAKGPRTRSFQNMTDADIVTRIAADYGFDTDIHPTSQVYEYVLQSSQSDYAFLQNRAERIGFDLWVADDTLHFKEQPRASQSPPALKWGDNLHKFKVRFSSAERCDEVTVRGSDPLGKAAIVGRAEEGDPGTTAPAASDLSRAARAAFGEVKRFAGQFPVGTQAEADALARSLLLRASGDEVVARGEAQGDPLIAAGASVEVSQVGRKLSGAYRITSVEHLYGAGTPYVTRFVCGGKEPAALADLMTGSSGSGQTKRGWGSLVVGQVTNIDDPQKMGRVKVWYRSLTDGDESGWARVVIPGGGGGRGMQSIPEVGDEVLVGFEHDDKTRPVVLGGLWNSQDAPPAISLRGGKLMHRVWASRNGHRVELNDADQDAGFVEVLHAQGVAALRLEKADSSLSGDDELTIRAKKVVIEADTDLVLEAANVTVRASGELTLQGAKVGIN